MVGKQLRAKVRIKRQFPGKPAKRNDPECIDVRTLINGIGYGLLRLARPALVPAVLTLAPPERA